MKTFKYMHVCVRDCGVCGEREKEGNWRAKEVLSTDGAQKRGIMAALYCRDYKSRKGFVGSVL